MNRAEATRLHTQLAVAWLWHARGCRVIADEVGVSSTGQFLYRASECLWRADVVGVRTGTSYSNSPNTPDRFDLVEVKGHRADWRRELPKEAKRADSDTWTKPSFGNGSKWVASSDSPMALWLLVSATVTDDDLELLPDHWGILRANEEVTAVDVVRRAKGTGAIEDPNRLMSSWRALGIRARSAMMPQMMTRATNQAGKIEESLGSCRHERAGMVWP